MCMSVYGSVLLQNNLTIVKTVTICVYIKESIKINH